MELNNHLDEFLEWILPDGILSLPPIVGRVTANMICSNPVPQTMSASHVSFIQGK